MVAAGPESSVDDELPDDAQQECGSTILWIFKQNRTQDREDIMSVAVLSCILNQNRTQDCEDIMSVVVLSCGYLNKT